VRGHCPPRVVMFAGGAFANSTPQDESVKEAFALLGRARGGVGDSIHAQPALAEDLAGGLSGASR
jgi:hypothetical protein